MRNLNSVLVQFQDSSKNYETSVGSHVTQESATKYFAGKQFNVGRYPAEEMHVCTGVIFTDNNK